MASSLLEEHASLYYNNSHTNIDASPLAVRRWQARHMFVVTEEPTKPEKSKKKKVLARHLLQV